MSSSPQQGIEGFITTHGLSSCSMTWSAITKRWLVIVSKGNGVRTANDPSLKAALVRAVSPGARERRNDGTQK